MNTQRGGRDHPGYTYIYWSPTLTFTHRKLMNMTALTVKKPRKHRTTPAKLAKIRVDYEQAIGSQVAIAKKHKISRVHLWELAKEFNWEYGVDRDKAIQKFQQIAQSRLNDSRMETIEEHAVELSRLREELGRITNIKQAKLLESRIASLLKIIEGERLTFGLPNEYKYSEQKTEKVVRFEDILKTINAKKHDYQVIDQK